jgi:hypothetical protein
MPGVYNNYAVGYREVIFLVPETVFGTPVHPSPTHAAQFLTADLSVAHERVNRNDKTSTRSYRERISHRKSGSWSMNLYVLPSGSNLTPPDITDALERGIGTLRAVPNTAILGTASTTTVINVSAGHGANYAINDAVGMINPAGDLEMTFVKTIATDALTVSPALSFAPTTAAATVYGSTTYKLGNVLNPLTLTRVLDNLVTVYSGCWVNDVAFDFPGDAEATLTVGGGCKEEFASGTSTLAGAMLVGATSFTVPAGEGYRFEKNTRVMINAEGANTDEVVLITDVNYATDTLTVTRAQASTAASAHAISAVVGPYEPSMTVAGSPITGTKGEFVITGATASARDTHETTTQGLTITNNITARNNAIGQESATGFFSTGKREVGFSVTLWLTKDKLQYYNKAKRFVLQEILMQWGKEVGKSWAAKVGQAEFNIPAIDGGGDDEVMLSFSGIGLASAAGNDECVIAYC